MKLFRDGWKNVLTGILSKKDKRAVYSFSSNYLTDTEKWNIYIHDKMLSKIIDLIPNTALKKPIEIKTDYNNPQQIHDILDNLELHKNLATIWKYSRLLGGGVIILNIQDGRLMSEPVNYSKISSISVARVVTKEYFYMKKEDYDYLYSYNQTKIHKDRCLIIDGEVCNEEYRWNNNGWGANITDSIIKEIYYYHLCHEVPSILLTDFSKPIYKLKDLNMKMVHNEQDVIQKMQLLEYISSSLNAVVLDSEDDYQRVEVTSNGLDKLLYQIERKLCALTNIPHTLLLNEAPEGALSRTKSQQQEDFYDFVENQRNINLTGPIKHLFKLIKAMLKINYLDFEFANLFLLDKKEEAEIKKIKAEASKIRIENILNLLELQIITVEEARNLILKEENLIDNDSREVLNEGSWQ